MPGVKDSSPMKSDRGSDYEKSPARKGGRGSEMSPMPLRISKINGDSKSTIPES